MAGRVVFFLNSGTYEPAYQAASLGITATAMGEEVYFVFAFEALRQLARGSFGHPRTERESAQSARAQGLNVPAPMRMLTESRAMGAKLIACETTVRICGFSPEDFADSLDEILGLASIWRLTDGARVLAL